MADMLLFTCQLLSTFDLVWYFVAYIYQYREAECSEIGNLITSDTIDYRISSVSCTNIDFERCLNFFELVFLIIWYISYVNDTVFIFQTTLGGFENSRGGENPEFDKFKAWFIGRRILSCIC